MSVRRRSIVQASLSLALLSTLPAGALAADTQSSARPPALEGRTGCELWVGTVSGNDPSVLVEALVCEGINGAVTGQLQWSSLQSGYSIRDVAGSWSEGHAKLTLHDTKLVVNKPKPGWVFCEVDQYDLARTGDKLDGSYRSQKCHDTATVKLAKKAQQPEVAPAAPVDDPGAGESEAHEVEDTKKVPTSSCLCEAARPCSNGGAWLAIGGLLIATSRALSCAAKPRDSRSPRRDSSR
jgi:hypothetical protein